MTESLRRAVAASTATVAIGLSALAFQPAIAAAAVHSAPRPEAHRPPPPSKAVLPVRAPAGYAGPHGAPVAGA